MRIPFPRPSAALIVLAAVFLHGGALWWAHSAWQPRSQIELMAEPVYARLIQAREPAALPRPRAGQQAAPAQPRAAVSDSHVQASLARPDSPPAAVEQTAPKPEPKPAPKAEAKPEPKIVIPPAPAADKPLFAALGEDEIAPLPTPAPELVATPALEEMEPFVDSSPSPSPTPTPTAISSPNPNPGAAESALASASAAATSDVDDGHSATAANGGAQSTGTADVYQDWPLDTRINVKITGQFRGAVHGSGKVTWQRQAEKYQAQVALSFGIGGLTMTSQGAVTPDGLNPLIFEENIVGRLRSAHFEPEAITIGSGKRILRAGLPGGLGTGSFQDSASQFVELAWRFATGRATLAPGSTVTYWLGRPEGLYQYIYDISGPEPMQLAKFGTVNTWHLTPRPIPGLKKDAIYGEIWIAPSLQYLPVKIRMRNAEGVYLDLLVDSMEQGEAQPKPAE